MTFNTPQMDTKTNGPERESNPRLPVLDEKQPRWQLGHFTLDVFCGIPVFHCF